MTDPISGVSAKALSAIKPEQKKDEELRSADVESQDAPASRQMSDEVQLSDETAIELVAPVLTMRRLLRSNKRLQMEIIHWIRRGLQRGLRRLRSYCSLRECSQNNYWKL